LKRGLACRWHRKRVWGLYHCSIGDRAVMGVNFAFFSSAFRVHHAFGHNFYLVAGQQFSHERSGPFGLGGVGLQEH
jgi:hypothetical protein